VFYSKIVAVAVAVYDHAKKSMAWRRDWHLTQRTIDIEIEMQNEAGLLTFLLQ
jgi:hypothetical protein